MLPPEHRDNLRPLVWSSVALFATVIAVVAGVFGWRAWSGFDVSAARPIVVEASRPSLQSSPLDDRYSYEKQQQEALHGYAWVDRNQRIARIPIERAMQLLSERRQ